jgi:hypothetical protein
VNRDLGLSPKCPVGPCNTARRDSVRT